MKTLAISLTVAALLGAAIAVVGPELVAVALAAGGALATARQRGARR